MFLNAILICQFVSLSVGGLDLRSIFESSYTPLLPTILQYFRHLMRRVKSLEKTDAGRDWGQEEKGTTEDEMAGWHHGLDGLESE